MPGCAIRVSMRASLAAMVLALKDRSAPSNVACVLAPVLKDSAAIKKLGFVALHDVPLIEFARHRVTVLVVAAERFHHLA